jgi:hypothetical protein
MGSDSRRQFAITMGRIMKVLGSRSTIVRFFWARLDINRHSQQAVNGLGWRRDMKVLGYMYHLAVRAFELDVHADTLHTAPQDLLISREFQAVEQVLGRILFDARATFSARRLRQVGIKLICHCTQQYAVAVQIHTDISVSRVPDLVGGKPIAP